MISLTHPLSTASSAGSLLPWEQPYRTEPIATLDHNGANLFHIRMSPSVSTRILCLRVADGAAPSLQDTDPLRLINREADVLRVAAQQGGEIGRDALAAALEATGGASALMLLSGWGDVPVADEARLRTAPWFSPEAAELLATTVAQRGIDLVLTDLPYLTDPAATHAGRQWLAVPGWQRPPWPSSTAAAYLDRFYPRDQVLADWAPTVEILRHALLVLGLAGGGSLRGRTRLTVAPLNVSEVGEAPCTVVAEP
jgi:kynurenine formamidase